MSQSSNEVFRLSWRSSLIATLAIIHFVLMVFTWPHITQLIFQFIFGAAIILFLSVIKINEQGIVLYYINKLPWSNIASVQHKTLVGLPYLIIKRQNGFSWWLPLYFQGSRPIQAALLAKAPIGNPVYTYAKSTHT